MEKMNIKQIINFTAKYEYRTIVETRNRKRENASLNGRVLHHSGRRL